MRGSTRGPYQSRCPLNSGVRAKLPAATLVQRLGETILALHDQRVSADDLSAALLPVLSSWALGDVITRGG